MRIEILGSAEAADFRSGIATAGTASPCGWGLSLPRIAPQTQVAVSNDGHSWFLLNASPDLRMQIERMMAVRPRSAIRDSQ
jgi:pyrroloquinoline quinone biosynthesis protein B